MSEYVIQCQGIVQPLEVLAPGQPVLVAGSRLKVAKSEMMDIRQIEVVVKCEFRFLEKTLGKCSISFKTDGVQLSFDFISVMLE